MATQLQTSDGLLIIPGAYAQFKVQAQQAGLAANGIVVLMGEADQGPDYTAETSLELNRFGPDEFAAIQAKYGSGPLVDASRELIGASADPDITGSLQRIIIAKTNVGGKASTTLTKLAGGTYSSLLDRSSGQIGNLITATVTANVAEAVPTTGAFTLLIAQLATDVNLRVNGGAAVTYTIAAAERPPTTVTGLAALTGVAATGGTDRTVIQAVAGTLAVAIVSGNAVTFTISTSWAVTPTVGDSLYVSSTSAIKNRNNQNCGSYVVTAATSTVISATKLLDNTGVQGTVTPPVAVSATSIASTSADLQAYAPVTVSVAAGTAVDGLGKSLEFAELTSAAGRLSDLGYQKNTTKVTWVSTVAAPTVLSSGAEYQPKVTIARSLDGLSDDLVAGGGVVLTVGYKGTTASAVVTVTSTTSGSVVTTSAKTLAITVTGGTGTSTGTITLSNFPTIGDLCAYLNTLTGYSAAPGPAPAAAAQPTSTLDGGTFTCASTQGAKTGRIKQDAYKFLQRVQSSKVQLGNPETRAVAGVPATATTAFFTGGSRGATTDAIVTSALQAVEAVTCNFVVPLFSNDATVDIADGLTDSASSYTIAGIHAATKTHCLSVSTFKRRRNRQGFVSIRDTFLNDQATSAGLGTYRLSCTFQDVRVPDSSGHVVQQRPWMLAVKAAGMQAAGLYRDVTHKAINIGSAIQAAADYDPFNDSQTENAMLAGLLIARRDDTGTWNWASDQTTYAKDDNFVFNSIQAVYAADIVTLTAARRMEKALVGQSTADVSVAVVKQVLEKIFADLLQLKILSPSADAPGGFRGVTIKIQGNSVLVGAEVKLSVGIKFVTINFVVTQVVSG